MEAAALVSFAEVAAAGSFSAAARSAGRSRQSLHREIGELERRLGLRLFERSTRKLRVTDIGQRLLVHADRIRDAARAASEEMKSARSRPSGTLRLTAPELLGEIFVAPVIAEFLERYPDVRVEATLTLDRINLIEGGFDLAVRAGPIVDSALIARPLGRASVVCCAAPRYLEKAAALRVPADITRHRTIHYGRDTNGVDVAWSLGDEVIRHRPRLTSTSARAVLDAARRGLGVARLPLLACSHELETGELVEVLAPWRDESASIHALYASQAASNPTLKAFLDVLRRSAARASWLRA